MIMKKIIILFSIVAGLAAVNFDVLVAWKQRENILPIIIENTTDQLVRMINTGSKKMSFKTHRKNKESFGIANIYFDFMLFNNTKIVYLMLLQDKIKDSNYLLQQNDKLAVMDLICSEFWQIAYKSEDKYKAKSTLKARFLEYNLLNYDYWGKQCELMIKQNKALLATPLMQKLSQSLIAYVKQGRFSLEKQVEPAFSLAVREKQKRMQKLLYKREERLKDSK